jgi:hypothetical protein
MAFLLLTSCDQDTSRSPVKIVDLSPTITEIPVIEQLVNLNAIVGEEDVVFVGFPLKLTGKAGDAGVMRAVALVY